MTMRTLRQWSGNILQRVLGVASRAYVPGPRIEHAVVCARRLERASVACTLGYFNGEHDMTQKIVRENCKAIREISNLQLAGYLSVKAPPLGYAPAALDEIAAAARRHGQLIHFDSHGPETVQPTRAALERLRTQHPDGGLGLTLPGRWSRSLSDAEWALRRNIRVRIVKGQWADTAQPDTDAREGFLALVDRLAGRAAEVAVATHDVPLAREALTRLQRAGTACEVEVLYGLPRRELLALAHEFGVPVRCYIPYGQAWMPYALRQAAHNPRVLWWTLRDTVSAVFQR